MKETASKTESVISGSHSKLSLWKVSLLGVLLLGSAFLLGYALDNGLLSEGKVTTAASVPTLVMFGVFLLLSTLTAILINSKQVVASLMAGAGVAVAVGFLTLNAMVLIGAVVLAVFFVWGGYLTQKELSNSINIRFFAASRAVLVKVIFGLAIFAALIFFDVFSAAPLGSDNPILPQGFFESSAEKFSGALPAIFGNDIDFSKSLTEIANQSLDQVAQDQGVEVHEDTRQELLNRTLEDLQSRIEKMFGARIDPDIKLSSAIYGLLLQGFNDMNENIRMVILAAMAFALLLMVQAVAPIIRIVITVLAFLIYEALRAMGFVSIVFENKNKEILILS